MRRRPHPISSHIVVIPPIPLAPRRFPRALHPRRPHRRPGRNVQLLALRHETVPRQRVGILAADQRAQLAPLGVDDPQAVPVAGRPRQLLEEGGRELAMQIQHAAVRPHRRVGVEQRAGAVVRPFREAHADVRLGVAGSGLDGPEAGPVRMDGLRGHPVEERMVLGGRA